MSTHAAASGTIVEMRIPMRPHLATQPGLRLLIDAAVTLSNAEGTASALHLPLFSRDSGDMATQDVYSEALLRPQNWVEAVLE